MYKVSTVGCLLVRGVQFTCTEEDRWPQIHWKVVQWVVMKNHRVWNRQAFEVEFYSWLPFSLYYLLWLSLNLAFFYKIQITLLAPMAALRKKILHVSKDCNLGPRINASQVFSCRSLRPAGGAFQQASTLMVAFVAPFHKPEITVVNRLF